MLFQRGPSQAAAMPVTSRGRKGQVAKVSCSFITPTAQSAGTDVINAPSLRCRGSNHSPSASLQRSQWHSKPYAQSRKLCRCSLDCGEEHRGSRLGPFASRKDVSSGMVSACATRPVGCSGVAQLKRRILAGDCQMPLRVATWSHGAMNRNEVCCMKMSE